MSSQVLVAHRACNTGRGLYGHKRNRLGNQIVIQTLAQQKWDGYVHLESRVEQPSATLFKQMFPTKNSKNTSAFKNRWLILLVKGGEEREENNWKTTTKKLSHLLGNLLLDAMIMVLHH